MEDLIDMRVEYNSQIPSTTRSKYSATRNTLDLHTTYRLGHPSGAQSPVDGG